MGRKYEPKKELELALDSILQSRKGKATRAQKGLLMRGDRNLILVANQININLIQPGGSNEKSRADTGVPDSDGEE